MKYGVLNESQQLATLPTDCSVSTIAGRGLNFRIRNGNGCCPSPMTTEKLFGCEITAANFKKTNDN